MSAPSEWTVETATELLLDCALHLADGKDDDELVFMDGFMREMAERCGVVPDWADLEPVPAAVFRERFRAAKAALAAGGLETR